MVRVLFCIIIKVMGATTRTRSKSNKELRFAKRLLQDDRRVAKLTAFCVMMTLLHHFTELIEKF